MKDIWRVCIVLGSGSLFDEGLCFQWTEKTPVFPDIVREWTGVNSVASFGAFGTEIFREL